jgi:hypothetical protein
MEKIKIALILLTIAISVGPLVGALIVYRDNLTVLVFPPEIEEVANGEIGSVALSDFEAPTITQEPEYNPDTGDFSVAFNFTNPLPNEISVDHFSAQVKSRDNNALLGNVNLAQPIDINPGENGIIDVVGSIDAAKLGQIKAQYEQDGVIDVILENVDASVAGVKFHFDQLDLGSIQLPR